MAVEIRKREGKRGVRYQVVADIGRDPATGNRRRRSVTVSTRAEARRTAREMERLVERGEYVDRNSHTVREVFRRWSATKKAQLRRRSWELNELQFRTYVAPRLGDRPIAGVTAETLDTLFVELLESGGKNGAPLSRTTVLHVHRLLNQVFNYALDHQLLVQNPSQRAHPPRRERKETMVPSPKDVGRLFEILAEKRRWALGPARMAAATGMRRGEILGLRWGDIDLAPGDATTQPVLFVRRQVVDDQLTIETPKTASSRRYIVMDPNTQQVLCDALEFWYAETELLRDDFSYSYPDAEVMVRPDRLAEAVPFKEILASPQLSGPNAGARRLSELWFSADRRPHIDDYVFFHDPTRIENGIHEPIKPHSLSQAIRFARDFGNLPPGLSIHKLRHFAATQMVNRISLKYASTRLGHSSTAITADLYQHVTADMDADAARILGEDQTMRDLFGR